MITNKPMENLYKQFVSGDTRVSIYQDQEVTHPFLIPCVSSGLACWSDNEIYGSFLPEDQDAKCLDSKEVFQKWLKDHPDTVVMALSWWGRCGSDTPYLTLHEEPSLDYDGVVFHQYKGADDEAKKQAVFTIQQEVQLLNAYLGGCVYAYVIETRKPLTPQQYQDLVNLFQKHNKYTMDYAPTYEQVVQCLGCNNWTVIDGRGGYYHNLDNAGYGDREMYRSMFEYADKTDDMHNIFSQMMAYRNTTPSERVQHISLQI
jgi:hypothetical protein